MIVSSVVGSIAESTFNPKWISNLQLWYDGADASTLFNNSTGSTLAAHSESIGRWEDKSGNNYHATQSDSTLAPIRITSSYNGLDTVRFFLTPSATGSFLLVTGSGLGIMNNKTACTSFIVFSSSRRVQSNIFAISNNNTGSRYSLISSAVSTVASISSRLDLDTTVSSITGPAIVNASVSGSTLVLITNQVLYNESSSIMYSAGSRRFPSSSFDAGFNSYSGSTSATNSARIVIGNTANINNQNQYLDGNIAELIFYNSKLNDVERRAVERYLGRKWNFRSYDQKTSASTDIFSDLEVYVDANNSTSNPGSGTTWTDLSGNGRNGTLTNGAVFATSESISYVSCDGTNDFVNFGNICNFTSQSFSVSGWFWFPTTEYLVEIINFANKGINNTSGFLVRTVNANFGQTGFNTSQAGVVQQIFSQGGAISPNRWWFLTITRNGTIGRVFVNGTLALQAQTAAIINPVGSSTNFVSAFNNSSTYSNLRIGLLIVHTKALSDQEVLELYNFTKRTYNIID